MTPHRQELPLVSVIIPVYNVLPFLPEALDSVISQTYRRLEILVIDDGSTDGSGQLCDEYGKRDPRIRVIHQENRGLSGARNTGLDRMTGEIVAFLDSDDFFHPEMVRKMVAAMTESGAEMAVCQYERTDGRRRGQYPARVLSSRQVMELLLSGKMGFSVWNKLFRRELWDGVRFPEGRVFEDTAVMHLLVCKSLRIQFLSDALMTYRVRPGSIMRSCGVQNAEDWIWSFGQLSSFVSAHTPERFTAAERDAAYLCVMKKTMNRYVQLYLISPRESAEARRRLRLSILQIQKDVRVLPLFLRIGCQVFRYCPPLALPLWQIYRLRAPIIRFTESLRDRTAP